MFLGTRPASGNRIGTATWPYNAHTAEVIGLRSRTRIRVRDFVPTWKKIPPPARLKDIRKWLNVMLAHLTMHRTEPTFKIGEVTRADI